MKKFLVLSLAASAFALTNCAPSSKQLKEAVEKDPSIVFAAIEKDPEKFIEVVNAAAQKAQKGAQEKAMAEEGKKRDEEFKNPLKPDTTQNRVVFGNKNAPITIVEYSDFECPYCSRGYQTLKQVEKEYGDKVRVIYKHMPLEFHPKAMPAARFFEAVEMQNPAKVEKFHDTMFENQNKLKAEGDKYMMDVAKKLGLDTKKIATDLKSEAITQRIDGDIAEAQKFGFSGTPGFIINGVSLRGAYPFSEFKQIIDKELADAGKGGADKAAPDEKKSE